MRTSLASIYESESQTEMNGVCWTVVEIQPDKWVEIDLESAWITEATFGELGELLLEPRRYYHWLTWESDKGSWFRRRDYVQFKSVTWWQNT